MRDLAPTLAALDAERRRWVEEAVPLTWHVAYTNAGQELLACERLGGVYRVLWPHWHVTRPHRTRRRQTVDRAVAALPRYAFFGRAEGQGLLAASSCLGVAEVLQAAGEAQAVSLVEVMAWLVEAAVGEGVADCRAPGCLGRLDGPERAERRPVYAPGDEVTVTLAGGWHMQRGTIDVDTGARCRVALTFFGASRVVDLDPRWLSQ